MAQLEDLNLRDYWNIFLKRKTIIIVTFMAVCVNVVIFTSLQTPLYTASAVIKIDLSQDVSAAGAGILSFFKIASSSTNTLADYKRQIISDPVLGEAARNLEIVKEGMSEDEINSIVSGISSNVEAVEIEKTNLLKLSARSKDPRRSANLVNEIIAVFKRLSAGQQNQRAHQVRVFIEKTLNRVEKKLRAEDDRMIKLTMQGAMGSGVNLINQIYLLEQKRTELLTRFTAIHPDVVRMDSQIKELKEGLKNLPKEEYEFGILKRDMAVDEAMYTALKQRLSEAQIREAENVDNVFVLNPAIPPKHPSYPKKATNYAMGILLGVIMGITTALIVEHIDTSIGKVEDVENFIKVNVLGVIPFYQVKDKEDKNRRNEPWRWTRKGDRFKRSAAMFSKFLNEKILRKKTRHQNPSAEKFISIYEEKDNSIFLEAFRILSVNLQAIFGKGEKIKNKAILITSCNPEEGKSITATHLGITMAQLGYKVLIMDADPRRPAIHKIFNLNSKESGLLDVLTGKVGVEPVIKTATDIMLESPDSGRLMDRPWLNNVNILTSGSTFPNPATLFNSEKMKELITYLRNKYDIVLVDTAPILAVSEPSILLPMMDGVLLVYRAGTTSKLALRRAKTQINSVRPGLLAGVILNNVTPEAVGVDNYYYYNRKYYGAKDAPNHKNMREAG